MTIIVTRYLPVLMLFLSVMLPLLAFADDKCVPEKEAISAWDNAVSLMERPIGNLITSTVECDPCKCPTNGMASCYEFMASKERAKEQRHKEAVALLERAKKYGICR